MVFHGAFVDVVVPCHLMDVMRLYPRGQGVEGAGPLVGLVEDPDLVEVAVDDEPVTGEAQEDGPQPVKPLLELPFQVAELVEVSGVEVQAHLFRDAFVVGEVQPAAFFCEVEVVREVRLVAGGVQVQ